MAIVQLARPILIPCYRLASDQVSCISTRLGLTAEPLAGFLTRATNTRVRAPLKEVIA